MTHADYIKRVENFRDRYMEWAEKDETDVNVEALSYLHIGAGMYEVSKKPKD